MQTTPNSASLAEIQKHIEILENPKIEERQEWFAAVKALVNIGPPAVPALSEATRKTDNPRAQSTMAMTLRAIGDSSAVPALIDALEKSGFSSDYGVGKPDTELAQFIHRIQIDPSRNSIGLGRPVREITIALERLTDHTEGHDHFYAYDENGKRLASYTITPEIRDREREHRKQVAQRWRTWWQDKQEGEKGPGMIVGASDGSHLEFYILPEPDAEEWDGLTPDDITQYRQNLQAEGPWAGSIRGDSYQWLQVEDDFKQNGLIVETYQGQRYADHFQGKRFVLHAARAAYAMYSDRSWGLKEVVADSDNQGRPAIRVTFDPAGTGKFTTLTKNNVNRRLAIIIDGKVIRAPRIMTVLSEQAIITGGFTENEVKEIVDDLKKGMPPMTFELKKISMPADSHKVTLPDFDAAAKVLDIKSGKLAEIPNIQDDDELIEHYKKTNTSIAGYDPSGNKGEIVFVPCQVLNYLSMNDGGFASVSFEFDQLPIEFDIETQNGTKYRVKVISADKNNCAIEYFAHESSL